jgi:hypothetical protein
MKIVNYCFCLLVVSILSCKNEPKDLDSIINKRIDSIAIRHEQRIAESADKIKAFLESGQQGVFEDLSSKTIITASFAIFINCETVNNEQGYSTFNYAIKSFAKNGDNWKIKDEKQIVSDTTDFKTSLPKIKWTDMNKDNEKDILLLMATDERKNEQYTLFLTKNKGQTFVKVEGFEKLYTPVFDPKKKVIVSKNSYSYGESIAFYTIMNDSLHFIEGKDRFFPNKEGDF